MRPTVEQLGSAPLFASLNADELKAIASLSELREEAPGTRLVGEGAPGHALFVLLEGTAAVTVGHRLRQPLGPGDFFGEIALLGGGGVRTASVIATSPITLAVMSGSDFVVFERDMPKAAEILRDAMRERLARGDGLEGES
ncbi:MAG TPA: cyclic nucleotide-binding domain-containing protein [Gaiellaceae bacterium]|jgi:CRP-like cAMP-binding protein